MYSLLYKVLITIVAKVKVSKLKVREKTLRLSSDDLPPMMIRDRAVAFLSWWHVKMFVCKKTTLGSFFVTFPVF